MATPVSAIASTPTTAVTPTSTAATGSAAKGPTATAFGLRTRFVHVQSAAAELSSVQSGYRALRLAFIRHFNESEASRSACIAIGFDADPLNLAVSLKEGTHALFGGAEVEVPYKDIFHAVSLRDLKAS
jgi:hypothetical protein